MVDPVDILNVIDRKIIEVYVRAQKRGDKDDLAWVKGDLRATVLTLIDLETIEAYLKTRDNTPPASGRGRYKTFGSLRELEAWLKDRGRLRKEYPEDKYRLTADVTNLCVIIRAVEDKTRGDAYLKLVGV